LISEKTSEILNVYEPKETKKRLFFLKIVEKLVDTELKKKRGKKNDWT